MRRLSISREAAVVAGAAVAFIALSVWWLLYDQRLPGAGDPGRHLQTTLLYADQIKSFELTGLITSHFDGGFFYPPLVRWIGAVPSALGLAAADWSTIALNVVFVPLLAAGCYLVGRLVYGPRAGLLAAVFALGTPLVLSLFHVFLLDAPLAAITAISLWALLASDLFEDRRMSLLAGLLAGIGLLVKTTAPVFLAGPVLVMLVRGGWRQWRNIGLALLVAVVVAAPWYLFHLDDITNTSGQASTGVVGDAGGATSGGGASQFFNELFYYGWAAVNVQYFVPLLLLFAVGLVQAIREFRTRPHIPELLAGLALTYLVFALAVSIRDPRYTLPLVVFVAVIATGWIAVTKTPWLRGAATGLLVATLALNVLASATDELSAAQVETELDEAFPGDATEPGTFTFFNDAGYVVGPPLPDSFWTRLFDAAERDGVKTAQINVREAPRDGADGLAFGIVAEEHGIDTASFTDEPPENPDLIVDTWWFTPDRYWIEEERLPPPCATVLDGTTAPEGSEAVPISVAVQRREGDEYRRWCDF